MAVFAISFRIHYDSTYDDRYASVVDAIKYEAQGDYWDETTSFFLISSDKASKDLAFSIYALSKLAVSKDLLVVLNQNYKGASYAGTLHDRSLVKLLPHITKAA